MIEIKLTKKQMGQLHPIFDQIKNASELDQPGMVLAQLGPIGVFEPNTFYVKFVQHNIAKKLQKVIHA